MVGLQREEGAVVHPPRRRRGTSVLEFALIVPILVGLVMSVIELSWYMHLRYEIQRAAQVGARIGSMVLEGASPDGTEITAVAVEHATGLLQTLGKECEPPCSVRAYWVEQESFHKDGRDWMVLRVEIDYPHDRLIPGMDLVPDMLVGRFTMVTLQQLPSDE